MSRFASRYSDAAERGREQVIYAPAAEMAWDRTGRVVNHQASPDVLRILASSLELAPDEAEMGRFIYTKAR